MANNTQRRKVLVLKDDSSIHNLLTLVRELGRENAVDRHGERVLASISVKQFETVILDLRCSNRRPEIPGIGDIWPNLVGKVLVINAEVNGPKTLQQIERCLLHQASDDSLLHGLATRVRGALRSVPLPTRI
jgi:hypothetical protein